MALASVQSDRRPYSPPVSGGKPIDGPLQIINRHVVKSDRCSVLRANSDTERPAFSAQAAKTCASGGSKSHSCVLCAPGMLQQPRKRGTAPNDLESAMELGFLMLTDHSEALNGKVYAMGGGWNMLRFPQLPQEWGFGIAFAIDVPWDQTNRRHTLTLHIEDPDGEALGDQFSMDFETGRPPGAVQGQDQRIVLSLGTRTTFSSSGPHAVVVRVGEDEVDRTRFYVLELPEMLTTGTQQQT